MDGARPWTAPARSSSSAVPPAIRSRPANWPPIVKVFEANPGMELLTGTTEWPVTNWDPATAQQQMTALLAQHPDIDGIISDYGSDLAGAIRAFQAAGRPLLPMTSTRSQLTGLLLQGPQGGQPGLRTRDGLVAQLDGPRSRSARRSPPSMAPRMTSPPTMSFRCSRTPSTTGRRPATRALSPDYYFSNKLSADDIAEWGVVQ